MKPASRKRKAGLEIFILIGLFLYFTYIIFDQQAILDKRIAEMKDIEQKIEEEKVLHEELLREKENINSDEYIERIAREKFGLVKSGEKVFVDINK